MSLRNRLLGLGSRWHRRLLGHFYGTAVVLMYHRVAQPPATGDLRGLCTPPELFVEHLVAFASRYSVMSLGEAALLLERGRKLPKKTLCLTFDDGYLDNFTVARAMLEAANLPATFFVATAGLQEGHHYSWEQKDNFAPSHVDARTLAELAQNSNLIEIGGHTHTHPRLALLSPDEQYQEIEQNRQLLTDICGSAPRVFAYPFGQAQDFNDASVEQVKRAGYEAAVCTTAGILSWRSDRFRIRRVDAHALSADDACVLIDKTFAY